MFRIEKILPKVIIITGPPLVGKTTYIRENYGADAGFHVFDFVTEYKNITGKLEGFPESDDVFDVYEAVSDKLYDALLFEKKYLVFEYCTGFGEMDAELIQLVNLIKESDTEVALIELTADMNVVMQRKESVLLDPSYVSSYYTNEPAINILTGFFEGLPANRIAFG